MNHVDEEATRERSIAAITESTVEKTIPLLAITVLLNPRQKYDRDALVDLADSIERHGQLQPVIVRSGEKPGTYDLIAGTRRHRAFLLLAERHPGDPRWTCIRASVQDHHIGGRLKAVQAIENIKRSDLSAIELADAVAGLKDEGMPTDDVAVELGYSRRHIERLLALGAAPEWVRAFADAVDVDEPMLDDAGNRVVDDEGRPRFKTKRLPGFVLSDLGEILAFHRALDAWDRKQQDQNTAHRAKAEPETMRVVKRAATAGLLGDRLKAALKSRLAELTGVGSRPGLADKTEPKKKPYEISEKRVVIDVAGISAPLSQEDLARLKPDLTAALQRLGFTTIKLA